MELELGQMQKWAKEFWMENIFGKIPVAQQIKLNRSFFI